MIMDSYIYQICHFWARQRCSFLPSLGPPAVVGVQDRIRPRWGCGQERRHETQHRQVLLHQPQQRVTCCILRAHTESCSTHCPLERQSDFSGVVVSQRQVAYLFFRTFPEARCLQCQKTSEKTLLQQRCLLGG